MQPAAAIPPLTVEGVKKLVGMRCKVPVASNPHRVWWVTIREVNYCTAQDAIVTIDGHQMFSRPKKVPLSRLTWRNQVYDPLIVAMIKARSESTK